MTNFIPGQHVTILRDDVNGCEGTIESIDADEAGAVLIRVRVTTPGAFEAMPVGCYPHELLPVREVGQ